MILRAPCQEVKIELIEPKPGAGVEGHYAPIDVGDFSQGSGNAGEQPVSGPFIW